MTFELNYVFLDEEVTMHILHSLDNTFALEKQDGKPVIENTEEVRLPKSPE